ncbi:MAG: hypothetical protein ABJH04_08835 [Cyclobacteriaceae bacterium]|jgi:hypothetical protein
MSQFITELLREPLLEFGEEFLSSDPKSGIARSGFFSLSNNQHRSEIHYAIIGTNTQIERTKEWIDQFEQYIQAEVEYSEEELEDDKKNVEIVDGEVVEAEFDDIEEEVTDSQLNSIFGNILSQPTLPANQKPTFEVNKRMNPDFPGFEADSAFKCKFFNDESNNKSIKELAIKAILESDSTKLDKALQITDLYIRAYERILEDSVSKPNICIIVVPSEVFKKLSSIKYSNGKYFNLRRYLKSQLIILARAIPVQILLEDTIKGTKKSLQDKSMQAWNFVTANYYKNGGIPWTLTLKDKTTCFIGISFHRVQDTEKNLLRSSIAQAFNYEGKGIIFIGKQFEWDSDETNTPAPHLTHSYAEELIQNILAEYKKYNKISPARVVIHKTTDFWDASIHNEYAEAEGFRYGITKALGEEVEIDLVTIKSSKIKLLRGKGKYPVLRGTLMKLSEKYGLLYTTGYIPYFESFPGVHVPHGLEVSIYEGDSTIRKVCDEIMALTKLNFNNCSYYDSLPITIRFAQRVGEIIQYMPDGVSPPNKYYYYM